MSSMVDKQEIIDMIRLKSPRLELVSFEAGKSEAWRWFKRVRVDGAVLPYAVCNGCFKPVHYTPRDGTGGLRRHACPLTVAMAQAKTGLTPKTPTTSSSSPMTKNGASTSGGNKRSGAATPDGNGGNGFVSSQASPRSRARRSATVPVSLTMWAAEKGLMDLTGNGGSGGGHHQQIPGLPSGGLSIASAFAALQGIVPRCSPYLSSSSSSSNGNNASSSSPSSSNNPQAHQQLLQLPPIDHHHDQHHSNGSPKMADSALDLAMKKTNGNHHGGGGDDDDDENHHHRHRDHAAAVIPLEERKDRAQSIVDHILLNISQQHQHHLQQLMLQQSTSSNGSIGKAMMTLHDANQNEQMTSSHRFSIMPPSRSSSNGSSSATRRPRKRSNPDRAIPSSNGRSSSATTNNNNVSSHNNNGQHHPDIEANLQMLAQVANEPPAVKRERISSPDALLDTYRYQMNGGQLTPTSQHSVPSPADVDGDHPHHLHRNAASTGGSGSSTGSSSAAFKSGASSPAQFNHSVPAHLIVPSSSTTPPSNEASSLVAFPNGHAHHDEDDDDNGHLVRIQPRSVGKPIENFAAAMHQVLSQGSPESSLADSAQLMQLNDLTACLHSLLDLHKKSLSALETRMPVPELQKPAPAFRGIAVVDGQFKEISLDDYKGKYVVLFFYPLDFTFVCPTEIVAFSERADEFRKINCELIACSTDSHFCHLAWVNTPRKQGGLGSLNLPLLADKSAQISKSYGVYKEDEGLTFRGLFIIDEQQRLRQVTINDLPVGRSVDETLRLVQAFQFTDKHGEVCPAGWTPGKKSMKADPAGSKEYFEASN